FGESYAGGFFGPELKFAGFDAIFISGTSPEPVYILVREGKAELREAGHLWGKDVVETETIIRAECGQDARIASIGPSGEKLSLISSIITAQGRAAARSGLGAVMGAKRLKAIAVQGQLEVPLADPSGLKEARSKYLKQLGGNVKLWRDYGTCAVTLHAIQSGDAPIKNWGGSVIDFPRAVAISHERVVELQQRKFACWRCPVACGGVMKRGTGFYQYREGAHKPEYETLVAFGSLCLNSNLESIIMANDICNRYGLDTISTGATIAFAIECYEKGLINKRDTGGIELQWGNHEAIVAMTKKIALREGLGDILADGVKAAAERIGKGAEEFAMHIHGQEVPMHDPKRYSFYAVTYLDATPARHTQGSYGYRPAAGLEFPAYERTTFAGRGKAHKMGSDLVHVVNCAGMCLYGYMFLNFEAIPRFLNLVTGRQFTLDDLLRIGERVANLRQAFNIREGVSLDNFKMPSRVIGQPPLGTGPLAGRRVELDVLLQDYLKARDWDLRTGKPSRNKLIELGLKDIARVLWPGEC
ncbi:MAG: aldehyde ferredoxin oxidoreductase, partial [Chloroflexi bacterium]